VHRITLLPNVKVLPPGHVGVIGVETVELMPVGSDDLFGVFVIAH